MKAEEHSAILESLLRQVVPPNPIIGCCDLLEPDQGWEKWCEEAKKLLGIGDEPFKECNDETYSRT